jgi:hypothetical protein
MSQLGGQMLMSISRAGVIEGALATPIATAGPSAVHRRESAASGRDEATSMEADCVGPINKPRAAPQGPEQAEPHVQEATTYLWNV